MFNKNLRKYCLERGYSQSELAKKLFVTRQCVSKWEKGVTQPDMETLVKISELLDVSVDVLLKSDDHSLNQRSVDFDFSLFVANILVALFCAISFVSLWRALPQAIPAHWTHGKIDRYGSSAEILLHIVSAMTLLIVDLVIFFVVKKAASNKLICVTHGIIILFQVAYFVFVLVLYANYVTYVTAYITNVSASVILCVSIAMHPKISRQNKWLGIRTADTLSNKTVWNKTNALACDLFVTVSLGILVINMTLALDLSYLCLLSYLVPAIVVVIYSKGIYSKICAEKGENDKRV